LLTVEGTFEGVDMTTAAGTCETFEASTLGLNSDGTSVESVLLFLTFIAILGAAPPGRNERGHLNAILGRKRRPNNHTHWAGLTGNA